MFNTTSGRLSGTPSAANVGVYSNITIGVSDSRAQASLVPFAIAVTGGSSGGGTGSATISWTAPTQNTDGSTLTNLAGFDVLYGTSASTLTKSIRVMGSVSTYVVQSLASGTTYYFAVRTVTSDDTLSALSSVVSLRIQ
jgi:hypothetical protein